MTAAAPARLPLDAHALTGAQRAAVLVVALGVETASRLLPELTDDEAEQVSIEVARLSRVPGELVESVLEAYRAGAAAPAPAPATGGLDAARAMLREGLGAERAGAVLPRVEAATEGTGFHLLQSVAPERVAAFLADEHPQTAAVVLAHLPARAAATVLAGLPADMRADVVRRLSTLAPLPAESLRELDAALRLHFGTPPAAVPGGVRRAADILTQAGRDAGRQVLEALQAGTPDLAGQIEDLLFVFDDLATLQPRALSRVLSSVDQSVLARALRGADDALSAQLMAAVSERVAAAIADEIENSPPLRLADVEDAQRLVIEATLALAESGEITLGAEAEAALV